MTDLLDNDVENKEREISLKRIEKKQYSLKKSIKYLHKLAYVTVKVMFSASLLLPKIYIHNNIIVIEIQYI